MIKLSKKEQEMLLSMLIESNPSKEDHSTSDDHWVWTKDVEKYKEGKAVFGQFDNINTH